MPTSHLWNMEYGWLSWLNLWIYSSSIRWLSNFFSVSHESIFYKTKVDTAVAIAISNEHWNYIYVMVWFRNQSSQDFNQQILRKKYCWEYQFLEKSCVSPKEAYILAGNIFLCPKAFISLFISEHWSLLVTESHQYNSLVLVSIAKIFRQCMVPQINF